MRTVAWLFAMPLLAVSAPQPPPQLSTRLHTILQQYVRDRGTKENITAASLSVSLKQGDPPILVAAGTMGHANSRRITQSTLFQIGSNTKAFTSALILQLESEGRLSISDRVGKWLPQYPAWKNVTIHQLLDMTSGITTYDNTPAFQRDYSANPKRNFSRRELIAYAYPKTGKATFHKGWYYSNTGYILAEMIAEKAAHKPYPELLQTRLFQPAGLKNAYYDAHMLPTLLHARLLSGYFASNDPDNAGLSKLYGTDVRDYSLSWAQGAGGIVATPADVSQWARALYTGDVLPAKQRAEMMTLVSNKTGRPIPGVSAEDPMGFGLGIAEIYDPALGKFWFYQGETLGYRVLHVWFPGNDVVLTVGVNSQPNEKENHLQAFVKSIVAALRNARVF
ncbi:MAG: beta-lactamase family protein [Candidatus Eremiobacteraeota bacterium]|nr:beta-lactamase family protein [Candidatus Eremiobacteraeota bacterium]